MIEPPPREPLPTVGYDFVDTPPENMVGRIVYLGIEAGTGAYHPFVTDPDGRNTVELVEASSAYSYSGSSWSPDGTRIAFASNLDGNAVWNIWVMNADGTGVTKVVATSPHCHRTFDQEYGEFEAATSMKTPRRPFSTASTESPAISGPGMPFKSISHGPGGQNLPRNIPRVCSMTGSDEPTPPPSRASLPGGTSPSSVRRRSG